MLEQLRELGFGKVGIAVLKRNLAVEEHEFRRFAVFFQGITDMQLCCGDIAFVKRLLGFVPLRDRAFRARAKRENRC